MNVDVPSSLPALGISRALSCCSVRARTIRLSHGWRRFGTALLADGGITRLIREFTAGGVELEPLHVRRHYLSNHRVEMNRHQPSCLPGRFDSIIASLHSNLLGQVAVTHSGRWATSRLDFGAQPRQKALSLLQHCTFSPDRSPARTKFKNFGRFCRVSLNRPAKRRGV